MQTLVRGFFYTYATVGVSMLLLLLSSAVGAVFDVKFFMGAGTGTGPGEVHGDLLVARAQASGFVSGQRIAVPLANGAAAVHTVRALSVDSGTLHVRTRDAQHVEYALRVRDTYGNVLFALPYLGYAHTWLSGWLGLAVLLLVPLCMVVFDLLQRMYSPTTSKLSVRSQRVGSMEYVISERVTTARRHGQLRGVLAQA